MLGGCWVGGMSLSQQTLTHLYTLSAYGCPHPPHTGGTHSYSIHTPHMGAHTLHTWAHTHTPPPTPPHVCTHTTHAIHHTTHTPHGHTHTHLTHTQVHLPCSLWSASRTQLWPQNVMATFSRAEWEFWGVGEAEQPGVEKRERPQEALTS